ncbi:MAG: DUF1778 domain-containing protein [Desulfosudis oleivorans]|nr:DUF1778 domain-containing protein [Desulfosudis oleivorans]
MTFEKMYVQSAYNFSINFTEVFMPTPTAAKRVSSRRQISTVRSGRLGLRTTPIQAALIQRAAEVSQKSITEFVLSSACEKAEQTILDQRLFQVDEETWKLLRRRLKDPHRQKRV